MKFISSKDNNKIKEITRLLSSKKERNDKGLFVVEGLRICYDTACGKVKIKDVFITHDCMEKFPKETETILKVSKEHYEITTEIAEKISDTKTPQGIFCICEMPYIDVKLNSKGNYLMLCSLQDPGNIGTIIRTCEAFKTDGLIMTADCPDIYSPKLVRSTMGAAFRLNIIIYPNAETACKALKDLGIKIYAAALKKDSKPITDIKLYGGNCIMIGNEGNGLSDDEINLADEKVIIPMNEESESLNAAVASSVFAWEMFKGKIEKESI